LNITEVKFTNVFQKYHTRKITLREIKYIKEILENLYLSFKAALSNIMGPAIGALELRGIIEIYKYFKRAGNYEFLISKERVINTLDPILLSALRKNLGDSLAMDVLFLSLVASGIDDTIENLYRLTKKDIRMYFHSVSTLHIAYNVMLEHFKKITDSKIYHSFSIMSAQTIVDLIRSLLIESEFYDKIHNFIRNNNFKGFLTELILFFNRVFNYIISFSLKEIVNKDGKKRYELSFSLACPFATFTHPKESIGGACTLGLMLIAILTIYGFEVTAIESTLFGGGSRATIFFFKI